MQKAMRKKIALIVLALILLFSMPLPAFAKITKADYSEIMNSHSLPYPGLLPDSKFYFLKMTRDKIISFLISDPLKKVEFDMLEADKRLNAGLYVFIASDEKKYNLATATISKGVNYLNDAVVKLKLARQQGINVSDAKGRLSDSLRKHLDILKRLKQKTTGGVQSDLQREIQRLEQLLKSV
jgi:hypothetical protein